MNLEEQGKEVAKQGRGLRADFLLIYCANLIHLNVFGIVSVLEADTNGRFGEVWAQRQLS